MVMPIDLGCSKLWLKKLLLAMGCSVKTHNWSKCWEDSERSVLNGKPLSTSNLFQGSGGISREESEMVEEPEKRAKCYGSCPVDTAQLPYSRTHSGAVAICPESRQSKSLQRFGGGSPRPILSWESLVIEESGRHRSLKLWSAYHALVDSTSRKHIWVALLRLWVIKTSKNKT